MPRTRYLPDRETPIGYAMAYQKQQYEDRPTVEVDLLDEGLLPSFVEAVCVALETWDPVFDHWGDPVPKYNQAGQEISSRKVPVFRGRHADKVLKFRADIVRYTAQHPTEQERNVFVKIASKYVHIRPTARGRAGLPHQDITHYARDVIRPVIRRSDPEWDYSLVAKAKLLPYRQTWRAHECVLEMLRDYDENRGTSFASSYLSYAEALEDDNAPAWEHWRMVSHYIQDIADAEYDGSDILSFPV